MKLHRIPYLRTCSSIQSVRLSPRLFVVLRYAPAVTFRTALSFGTSVAALAFLAWLFTFKIVDSDFWWHVEAGELLWNTKSMIRVDPFAYTREGLPYLARHEWLAQLLLYGVYSLGGPFGIVLLRIAAAAATFGILLSLDRRNLWPNAFLCLAAAIVMRQGFIERPQIFSNVLFAFVLTQGLRLLDLQDGPQDNGVKKQRRTIMLQLLIAQILWVNLHGAAAILSIGILGIILLSIVTQRRTIAAAHKLMLLPCLGLLAAMLVSPNGILNFTYLWELLTDKTASLIEEWNPHLWPQYLTQVGPFWIASFGSLLWTRRKPLPVAIILLTFGMLSRLASRHEALFLITALGCTFWELRGNNRWQDLLARFQRRKVVALGIGIAILFVLIQINLPYVSFLARKSFTGLGTFEPAKEAYAFLVDHGIEGRTFNTYRIGGYLLHRGAPERKVFLDGRNVDYGYDFLVRALDARYHPVPFRALEAEYGFTSAIIEYASTKEEGQPFEFAYLNKDPSWALVFLDDWTAVYLKRIPEHAALIDNFRYPLLTPEGVDRGTVLDRVSPAQVPALEAELQRMIRMDARGISALLVLAKLQRGTGRFTQALALLKEAQKRSPSRHEAYALEASIREAEGKWTEAAALYEHVLDLTRYLPVQPNFTHLAEVYEHAGDRGNAARYRRKAGL